MAAEFVSWVCALDFSDDSCPGYSIPLAGDGKHNCIKSHGLQQKIVLPIGVDGKDEEEDEGALEDMLKEMQLQGYGLPCRLQGTCALCNKAIEIAIQRCSRVSFSWDSSAVICLKLPRSRTCKLLSASAFLSLPLLTAGLGRHANTRIHAYVHTYMRVEIHMFRMVYMSCHVCTHTHTSSSKVACKFACMYAVCAGFGFRDALVFLSGSTKRVVLVNFTKAPHHIVRPLTRGYLQDIFFQ